jgi:hypothetical protein
MLAPERYDEPFRLTVAPVDESPFPPGVRGLGEPEQPTVTSRPLPTERIATVIRKLRAEGLHDDQIRDVINIFGALQGEVIDPEVMKAAFKIAGPRKRRFPTAEIVCISLGIVAGGVGGYMLGRGRGRGQGK